MGSRALALARAASSRWPVWPGPTRARASFATFLLPMASPGFVARSQVLSGLHVRASVRASATCKACNGGRVVTRITLYFIGNVGRFAPHGTQTEPGSLALHSWRTTGSFAPWPHNQGSPYCGRSCGSLHGDAYLHVDHRFLRFFGFGRRTGSRSVAGPTNRRHALRMGGGRSRGRMLFQDRCELRSGLALPLLDFGCRE